MINLQVLKTLLTYHQNLLTHKRQEIKAIASEIANLGPTQNREISTEICLLIEWLHNICMSYIVLFMK